MTPELTSAERERIADSLSEFVEVLYQYIENGNIRETPSERLEQILAVRSLIDRLSPEPEKPSRRRKS
jgi:hypothetical protein